MKNNQDKRKQTDETSPKPPEGPKPHTRRDFTLDKELQSLFKSLLRKKQK